MQPAGDRMAAVEGADRAGQVPGPGGRRLVVRGQREQVRLVAEVPQPNGRVVAERLDDRTDLETLGGQDARVDVGVAHATRDRASAADELAGAGSWSRSVQQPTGGPVRTAHVTREERHVQHEVALGGDVARRPEMAEGGRIDPVGGGLEVLPQQEDPDDLEAEVPDQVELVADLTVVEVGPPAHRLAAGPVVDAEAERPAGTERCVEAHRWRRDAQAISTPASHS